MKRILFVLTLVMILGLTTSVFALQKLEIESVSLGLSATEVAPGREFPRDFITATIVIKNSGTIATPYYLSLTPINSEGRATGSGAESARDTGALAVGERKTIRQTVWVYHDPDATYRIKVFLGDWWGDLPNREDEKIASATDRALHMASRVIRIMRPPISIIRAPIPR